MIDCVVMVLPELSSMTRRISMPALKVWRPTILVTLSMKESVVPTSVSSELLLSPSKLNGLVATGAVP